MRQTDSPRSINALMVRQSGGRMELAPCANTAYSCIAVFLFGIATTLTTYNIGKYVVGMYFPYRNLVSSLSHLSHFKPFRRVVFLLRHFVFGICFVPYHPLLAPLTTGYINNYIFMYSLIIDKHEKRFMNLVNKHAPIFVTHCCTITLSFHQCV